MNGNTEEVANYVLKWPVTTRFLSKLYDLMEFLIPYYVQEGKTSLLLGIGCTGGQHRSVTIANRLGDFLRTKGYRVVVDHRDIK